ncbi:MAG: hypothetical protein FJY60_08415 [Betaproteobacteria bacterium]|nr:hypothetical protein [Betaproteobacteria bacterium]
MARRWLPASKLNCSETRCIQNTVFKWATHGDNPVNGYRMFKRTDLDKLLKKVAEPVVPK